MNEITTTLQQANAGMFSPRQEYEFLDDLLDNLIQVGSYDIADMVQERRDNLLVAN